MLCITLGAIVTVRLNQRLVERCRPLGLGYRRRQLRHLPEPHYGLVYALCSPELFPLDANIQQASNARPIKGHQQQRNAQWLGVFAT